MDEMSQVAQLLDRAYGRVHYQLALQAQREKLRDPDKTLSPAYRICYREISIAMSSVVSRLSCSISN